MMKKLEPTLIEHFFFQARLADGFHPIVQCADLIPRIQQVLISPLDYLGDGSHNVVELFNNPGSCHVNCQFQRA
jgi:hypothetical protein